MSDQDTKMVNDKVHALLKLNKKFTCCEHEGWAAWHFKLDDGTLVYVLYNTERIVYNGKLYDMDEQNKLLVSKLLKKQQRRERRNEKREDLKNDASEFSYVVLCGLVLGGVIVGGWCIGNKVAQRHKVNKQTSEYRETLLNWNDSIRLAETDEELANAINRREQAKLKVKHYRDSLKRVR